MLQVIFEAKMVTGRMKLSMVEMTKLKGKKKVCNIIIIIIISSKDSGFPKFLLWWLFYLCTSFISLSWSGHFQLHLLFLGIILLTLCILFSFNVFCWLSCLITYNLFLSIPSLCLSVCLFLSLSLSIYIYI